MVVGKPTAVDDACAAICVGGAAGSGRLVFRSREAKPSAQVVSAGIAGQSLLLQQGVLDRDDDDIVELAPGIGGQPTNGMMDVLTDRQRRAAGLGSLGHLPSRRAVSQGFAQILRRGRKSVRRIGTLIH